MKKYILTRVLTSFVLGAVFVVAVFGVAVLSHSASNVFADADSGGNEYNGLDGCSSGNGTGTYYDNCHGVSWRKYSVDGDANIYKSQSQNDSSTPFSEMASRCKELGATEVYRLGYETFQQPFKSWDGRQGPTVTVSQTRKSSKCTGICATVLAPGGQNAPSGILAWDTVAQIFKVAAKFDNDGNDATIRNRDWDGTSWFCYNPDWKDGSGEFHSQSSVKTSKGTRKSGEDKENPNCMTVKLKKDETETEVTFTHQMRYESKVEATSAKVAKAESKWNVTTTSPGSGGSGTFTADPGSKTKAWESVKTETVKLGLGEGETSKTFTSKISYEPKVVQFEYKNGSYVVKSGSGSGSSSATSSTSGSSNNTATKGVSSVCVTVTKDPPDEEETKDPETDENSVEFQAYFYLRSAVQAVDNGYDISDEIKGDSGDTNPPGDENHVAVNFSTDRTTAEVTFSHWIRFDESMRNIQAAIAKSGIETGEDQWPEENGLETKRKDASGGEFMEDKDKLPDPPVCTTYSIEGDVKSESNVKFCVKEDTENPTQVMVEVEEKVTIDVSELNSPVKVCSKISAKDTANMKITEKLESGQKWYGEYKSCKAGYSDSSDANDKNAIGNISKCVKDDDPDNPAAKINKDLKYSSTTMGGETVMLHKNWELDFLGMDDSESSSDACAIVVRPGDPFEGDGIDPWSNSENAGIPASRIKYAGEVSAIGWKAKALFWGARQVTEHRTIAFLLNTGEGFVADKLKGNISKSTDAAELEKVHKNGHGKDPCTWYGTSNGRFNLMNDALETWCSTVDSTTDKITLFMPNAEAYYHTTGMNSGSNSDVTASSVSADIIAPNNVGYKYCNSSGYHWEYFWGLSYDGENFSFQRLASKPNLDYWSNYDVACRTIAKKPSVAFWNGGVSTWGGIITSLSPRSTKADGAKAHTLGKDHPNSFRLYGSWTEYIASANGKIRGFTSGATLSRGNSDNDIADKYSPLTITNIGGSLGGSGIPVNNTLLTRLQSYFNTSVPSSQITKLGVINGNLTITDDIEYDGPYSSIYQIPRTVYVVDGNVDIAPDVTRLDAWIIATGTVDTCAGFTKADDTKGYMYNGGTFKCDKQLVINGPVIAKNVKLNRTFGADPQRAYANPPTESNFYTPAEVFNLSAENYLWAYAQAGRYKSSYTDAYARELPPRY